MRYLGDVIDEMLKIIPPTEVAFVEKLEWLKNDVSYKAPELQVECWFKGSKILEAALGFPPKEDWQKKVANLWMGEEVY